MPIPSGKLSNSIDLETKARCGKFPSHRRNRSQGKSDHRIAQKVCLSIEANSTLRKNSGLRKSKSRIPSTGFPQDLGGRTILSDCHGSNQCSPTRRKRKPKSSSHGQKKGGTLLLRDTLEGVITDPKKTVSEKVRDLIFQFKAGEFFQNNPFILPQLVEHVIAEANPNLCRVLVDAYCGGAFWTFGCLTIRACDRNRNKSRWI